MKSMKEKTIKALELARILQLAKGKFIRIAWESDHSKRLNQTAIVDGKKIVNPFIGHTITKRYIAIARNYFDFEKTVNNHLEKEGYKRDFEAEPRTWGEHVEDTVFITHNDQLYLHLLPLRYIENNDTGYYVDGRRLKQEKIKPFIREKVVGPDPLDKIRNDVHPVNCKLQDITSIKVDSVKYNLILPSDVEIKRLVNRLIK